MSKLSSLRIWFVLWDSKYIFQIDVCDFETMSMGWNSLKVKLSLLTLPDLQITYQLEYHCLKI